MGPTRYSDSELLCLQGVNGSPEKPGRKPPPQYAEKPEHSGLLSYQIMGRFEEALRYASQGFI